MLLPSEKATELVKNVRQKTYGHPIHNFEKAVGSFNELTGHKLRVEEGVIFMFCLKMAREIGGGYSNDYTDSVDDIAGYANVLALVKEALADEAVG